MQNPPPGSATGQKTATGLEPNLAAALSYIWIVGLIFFFMEKENRFVRFNALQSVLYGVFWSVALIVLMVINVIIFAIVGVASAAAGDAGAIVSLIVWLISLLIWLVIPLAYVAGLIFAAIKAYQNKTVKLPIIGGIADKIVNK